MTNTSEDLTLAGQSVLVVGTGGIAVAVATAAAAAGARVVLGGRDAKAAKTTATEHGLAWAELDLADEESIASGLWTAGPLDHVVSTASAAANGPVESLELGDVTAAISAKLTGPLLLAKRVAPSLPEHGSLTFFSGVVAWRPGAGQSVMAMTNGGLAHLGAALAVELAPRRVNVISPGVIDSGMWDGPGRDERFAEVAASVPARRVGHVEDVAQATLLAMTNRFMTGSVLHVDGGGRWA